MCFGKKDYLGAIKHYTNAIQFDNSNEVYFLNRSTTYFRMSELEKALEDVNVVISLKPNWSKAHYRKGDIFLSLQKYNEAVQSFSKSFELDPNNPDMKKRLEFQFALATRIDERSFHYLSVH